jgi:hypothetical protein
MRRLCTVLSLVVFAFACNGRPEETKAPSEAREAKQPEKELTSEEKAVQEEMFKEEFEFLSGLEDRMQARQAIKSYIKELFPRSNITGIALLSYGRTLYEAGVDLSSSGQRRTLNLVVRLYVADSGESYWRVEPMSPDVAQSLSSYSFQKYKAKYKAEKSRNEELESKRDDQAQDEPKP